MKIIEINNRFLIIRLIVIFMPVVFVFLSWLTYDEETNLFKWFLGLAFLFLILWNILRYLFPCYKIINTIHFDNTKIIIGDDNKIIDLTETNKISFYKNGFKNESYDYNFIALNHFMPRDGINKLRIFYADKSFIELLFLVNSYSEMRTIEDWYNKLTINKKKIKFKGINI